MPSASDLNKATVEKFFMEAVGAGNRDLFAAPPSPSYKDTGEASSMAANQQWVTGLHKQFPGLSMSIEEILAENDLVALRWRMDVPASGGQPAGYFTATNIISLIGGQALTNWQTPAPPAFTPLPPAAPS